MAVTATPIFPQTLTNGVKTIIAADAQNAKIATSAGTNGSKVESWLISSTDTSARDVQIFLAISSVSYLLTTITIPAGAGNTASVPPINILGAGTQFPGLARDSNGNPYIYLAPGATLIIIALTTVTAAKTIFSVIQQGDY